MLIHPGNIRKYAVQAARMLVGIPDYDTYVQHMQAHHPDQPVMSYKAFFRERQQARYGGNGKGGMRCC
ncbi:YbdD/YjiX family protein [Erwinia mallotivora]|uniref:YbdD/YjiX family protein n=1 Tax=Erwinia mallotivora TaxID=69222 RepID=UPI0035E8683F